MTGPRLLSGPRSWHRLSVQWFSELFSPEDCATVILRPRRGPGKPRQMSRLVGHWCHPTGQRVLRVANESGSDVYCSVNPTIPRSSREVAEVRRLQVEFDVDGDARVRRLMADARSGRVAMPGVIVRSSPGRWQVLWHVDPAAWTREGAEDVNRRLAAEYEGDPAVVDVKRVMRVPGFVNCKPGRGGARAVMVPRDRYDVRGVGTQWWEPKAFRALAPVRAPAAPARVGGREPPAAAQRPLPPYLRGRRQPASQSEADWHGVLEALREGESPGLLVQELAEFRGDEKSNPRDYAERTVVRACRSLGIQEPETEYGRRHPARPLVQGR